MGAIARSAANLITTSGVVLKGAVNNDSFDNVTALPSSFGDGITLISSQTASASATISFTSGIDSTYKAYKFVFSNIHPSVSSDVDFSFQGSTNSGSSYGIAITSTYFNAYHPENDAYSGLSYDTGMDLAQSTSYQNICDNINGSHNDASMCGFLNLFNPSSTTFVKHFISRTTHMENDPRTMDNYIGGYINTTSAINAIQFKFSSGNIDAGTIYLYGIK
jgi:hypothetical protein